MLQPFMSACGLVFLLTVTAAEAQPQAIRGRPVTVAASPGEPLPELRVAAGSITVIVLDAPVDKGSVQLDTTRIRLVDVGEHSLIFETLVVPGDKERWVLRVRYADGAKPEWAAFALVAHPGEVDLQVIAVRQRQTLETCQEQLAAAQARCAGERAEVWVLADRLGGKAVSAARVAAKNADGTGEEWTGRSLHPPPPVEVEAAQGAPAAAKAPARSRLRPRWSRARTVVGVAVSLAVLMAVGAYLLSGGSMPTPAPPPVAAAEPPSPSPLPTANEAPPAAAPASSPLASPPPPQLPPTQPGSTQEKGTPVNTRTTPAEAPPSLCSQKQPPPRSTRQWRQWCQCAVVVGTLAATQAGCPAAQVRQSATEECTAESVAAMELLGLEFDKRQIEVQVDLNYPCTPGDRRCCDNGPCINEGPVISRVMKGKGKLVSGTLLSGQVFNERGEAHNAIFRWTEATLADGSKHPVCLEVARDGDPCPNGFSEQCPHAPLVRTVKKWRDDPFDL